VTSTAVQAGAESARVMSVTDVSTEHTNRHRATDRAPRANGRRIGFHPRAIMALVAHSMVRRSSPGVCSPRCSERGHTRALPIEESVILVTV